MSTAFGVFVLIASVGALIWVVLFLFSNWRTSGDETTGHEWDGIREYDNPLPPWWVGGFVVSIVFAFVYLFYYPGLGIAEGIGGWTSVGQWQEEQARHSARFDPLYDKLAALPDAELPADRVANQVGRRLYLNNCATCHGATAEGAAGYPNLRDDHWIWGRELAAIQTSIGSGRTAAMPGWAAALGEDGVSQTVEYVLALSGADHDTGLATAGKSHYDTLCVACHGSDGTGNTALGAPDLTRGTWLYGGDRPSLAETIANGRGGVMPAQRDLLGDSKVRILAGYVKSLQVRR